MFFKVIVLAALACLVSGKPAEVPPPGIHPSVCENYPFCDNEVLARYTAAGVSKPAYVFPGPDANVILPRVNELPAGIVGCPNYPYCGLPLIEHLPPLALPLPGFSERLYPPGIDRHACPNYPFCH